MNGGGDPHDVTGTDGGGQGRGQGGTCADGTDPGLGAEHLFETESQLPQGQESQYQGQVDAGTGNQNQCRPSPQETADLFKNGNRLLHGSRPFPQKALGYGNLAGRESWRRVCGGLNTKFDVRTSSKFVCS